ncbi:MAG: hypothetical protein R3F41_00390 [Gammaproteobacteria bacterium]|nr:hypothetical protein [Planctomycetaceae bacterium]MCB1671855.1 hypothetical protein [Pseudomonadales bacterium]MCP5346233.1 hypothetical protein [Pseudomonadales bacterium]
MENFQTLKAILLTIELVVSFLPIFLFWIIETTLWLAGFFGVLFAALMALFNPESQSVLPPAVASSLRFQILLPLALLIGFIGFYGIVNLRNRLTDC